MPNPRDIFLQNLQPKFDSKQNRFEPFRAVLTNSIGTTATGSVWKDENARLVYFRAWGGGSVSWALCDAIEPTLGLGVLIQFDQNINQYDVLRDDPLQRNTDSDRSSYRAITDNDLLKGGRFQLWLDPILFIPLSIYPTGADTVNVVSGDYIYQGERKTFTGIVDEDLSGSRPAAGLHRLVGLYLDNANTLNTVDGATIATGSDAAEPTWPAGAFRIGVVDIDNATDISIDDIDNRKIIYTEDEGLLSGAWPPPGKVYRWDVSAGLVIIEDSLNDAVTNADANDIIVINGTHTLAAKLTIAEDISIVGHYREGAIISGAFVGDLVEIAHSGTVSFKDIQFVTSNAGNIVGLSAESTGILAVILDRCFISATSTGGTADGIVVDSSSGINVIQLNQCEIEDYPNTTGFCINITNADNDASVYLAQGYYYSDVNTILNGVASGEFYLDAPKLDITNANIAGAINGATTYYGEYRDANGVIRYIGDDSPADKQFPRWNTDEWIPGYVDELWESDGGAVAWQTDADGDLIGTGDIFPKNDEVGLQARIELFKTDATEDDFAYDVLDAAWNWAGAPFVTPSVVTLSNVSILILSHNVATQRFFLYRTDSITTANWNNLIRATANNLLTNAYVGVRYDDGTDNNYVEAGLRYNGTNYELIGVYNTGGAGRTLSTYQTIYDIPKFMVAGVYIGGTPFTNWSGNAKIQFDAAYAVITYSITTGLTWTPTRRGIIFENQATTATFRQAIIDKYFSYV